MDLVNKLSLENGGWLLACVVTRDECPWHHKDGQRYFELENVYDEFSWPLRERRLSVETNQAKVLGSTGAGGIEPVSRIEEGAPIYFGISSRGRPEISLPRLRRPDSTRLPILLGRLLGSDSSCGYVSIGFVYP